MAFQNFFEKSKNWFIERALALRAPIKACYIRKKNKLKFGTNTRKMAMGENRKKLVFKN